MTDEVESGAPLFERTLAVRWRDLDAYDHVNNSVFLTLLEEARIQWFGSLPGAWRDAVAEPVLARTEMNYRAPIRYPASVRVQLGVLRVGRSSLTLSHRMSDGHTGQPYADGSSVIVWVSPADGRSVTIPAAVQGVLPVLTAPPIAVPLDRV